MRRQISYHNNFYESDYKELNHYRIWNWNIFKQKLSADRQWRSKGPENGGRQSFISHLKTRLQKLTKICLNCVIWKKLEILPLAIACKKMPTSPVGPPDRRVLLPPAFTNFLSYRTAVMLRLISVEKNKSNRANVLLFILPRFYANVSF